MRSTAKCDIFEFRLVVLATSTCRAFEQGFEDDDVRTKQVLELRKYRAPRQWAVTQSDWECMIGLSYLPTNMMYWGIFTRQTVIEHPDYAPSGPLMQTSYTDLYLGQGILFRCTRSTAGNIQNPIDIVR